MLSTNEIKTYLKDNLKERRYNHTLAVVKVAVELAKINSICTQKAEVAALVHDVAKNLSKDEMLNLIYKNSVVLSKIEKENIELWHSILAPIVAKEKFQIYDDEILDAIRWHTTGKENMSTLTKIIYISDMIEPNRNFNNVEKIKKITFENLDLGVFKGLTSTINFLLRGDMIIDENTIKARNYFLLKGIIDKNN